MIELLLFLLGVHLAVELTASAYRAIDLHYCLREEATGIILRLAGWGCAIALVELFSGGSARAAFNFGLTFFLIFHIVIYWIGQLLRTLQNRPRTRPQGAAARREARQ